MQNKLQELTEKLYNEGVSKAQQEAEKLLADAKAEADKIVNDAEAKAGEIKKNAEQEAEDFRKRVETEVRQAADQTMRSLKQEITELISSDALKQPVKEAFDDKDFLKKIIETAIKNWEPQSDEAVSLSVLLSEKDQQKLAGYLKSNTKKLLNKGEIVVAADKSMKGGFKIGPKDGSYQIRFDEEDFYNLFKAYLRPKTTAFLFKD